MYPKYNQIPDLSYLTDFLAASSKYGVPHGISDFEDEDVEDEITRRDNDILDMMHILNI